MTHQIKCIALNGFQRATIHVFLLSGYDWSETCNGVETVVRNQRAVVLLNRSHPFSEATPKPSSIRFRFILAHTIRCSHVKNYPLEFYEFCSSWFYRFYWIWKLDWNNFCHLILFFLWLPRYFDAAANHPFIFYVAYNMSHCWEKTSPFLRYFSVSPFAPLFPSISKWKSSSRVNIRYRNYDPLHRSLAKSSALRRRVGKSDIQITFRDRKRNKWIRNNTKLKMSWLL